MAGAGEGYLSPSRFKGTHEYAPDRAPLLSALLMRGAGLKLRDVGLVRMKSIGPSVGRFLGLQLSPDADAPLEPLFEASDGTWSLVRARRQLRQD